jgi:GNAT superfamily N-acetyltransferase
MENIEIFQIDVSEIDSISNLWYSLYKYHAVKSIYFKDYFNNKEFDSWKSNFIHKSILSKPYIELVKDSSENKIIGFCICSINAQLEGFIELIFVHEDYRNQGIGGLLLSNALQWFDYKNVNSQKVFIVEGNEDVLNFYSKSGFFPIFHILKRK